MATSGTSFSDIYISCVRKNCRQPATLQYSATGSAIFPMPCLTRTERLPFIGHQSTDRIKEESSPLHILLPLPSQCLSSLKEKHKRCQYHKFSNDSAPELHLSSRLQQIQAIIKSHKEEVDTQKGRQPNISVFSHI